MKDLSTTGRWVRAATAVLALMLISAAATAAHPGTWTAGEDLPELRYFMATAAVDGIIFAIGGSPVDSVVDTVFAYDPAIDTWQEEVRTPMPTPRTMATATVVDGKVYVIGGATTSDFDACATVEVYDPISDTWETRAEMDTARWSPAAAVVNGKIYIIGGGIGDALGEATYLPNVEVYDPATDSWDAAADLPTGRGLLSASVVDGMIYAVGGIAGSEFSDALEVYDPTTDTWTIGAEMTTARDSLATAAANGKVYAFGGLASEHGNSDAGAVVASEVEVYDPRNDTWELASLMPDPRWGLGAAVVDGTIHLIGGARGPVLTGSYRVDAYDPDQTTSWTEVAAHLPGSHGSQWQTDIYAFNDNDEVANVEAVLQTEAGDVRLSFEIGPGEQKVLEDVVGAMEVEGKGVLAITSDQILRISGRIFSEDSTGTFGQACEFGPMDDGFVKGDKVWLLGLRQETGLFRTNLALANTGIRMAAVRVKLFAGDGTEICSLPLLLAVDDRLEQVIEPFANHCGEPDLGWGYAIVEVFSGAGVRVSASVIDSRTNDATSIAAQR